MSTINSTRNTLIFSSGDRSEVRGRCNHLVFDGVRRDAWSCTKKSDRAQDSNNLVIGHIINTGSCTVHVRNIRILCLRKLEYHMIYGRAGPSSASWWPPSALRRRRSPQQSARPCRDRRRPWPSRWPARCRWRRRNRIKRFYLASERPRSRRCRIGPKRNGTTRKLRILLKKILSFVYFLSS